MNDVVIALIPASAVGVYQFGMKAFLVLLTCVVSSVLSEYIWNRLMKKPKTPYESSAIVTGLLLGMNLPASVPLWIPIVGSVFAIIVVKQMYGGLGCNFMNPALGARCFLVICFAGRMTSFAVEPGNPLWSGLAGVDGLASATPLAVVKNLSEGASIGSSVSISDMFFGFTGGTIGETSALAILIGAAYLLIRKVISLRIPLTYIVTCLLFQVLFSGRGFDIEFIAVQAFGGGLMLGAWFMATDYVTSPITHRGQIIYGVLLGLLTALIRTFSSGTEGVSFTIIFCNLLVPLIEKISMPRPFGPGGKKAGKEAKA